MENLNKYLFWLIRPKGSNFAYLMNIKPKYDKDPYYDYKDDKYVKHETTEGYLGFDGIHCFNLSSDESDCLEYFGIYPEDEKPVEFLLIGHEDKDEVIKLLSKTQNKPTTKTSLNKKVLF